MALTTKLKPDLTTYLTHFICVFTVCKSTHLGGRVYKGLRCTIWVHPVSRFHNHGGELGYFKTTTIAMADTCTIENPVDSGMIFFDISVKTDQICMRVWMEGGGGSGIHYSLKIWPIIHLIKILGHSFK